MSIRLHPQLFWTKGETWNDVVYGIVDNFNRLSEAEMTLMTKTQMRQHIRQMLKMVYSERFFELQSGIIKPTIYLGYLIGLVETCVVILLEKGYIAGDYY